MADQPDIRPAADPTLTARLTQRAAERAAARPAFMAWILARFREGEGFDEERLAAFLGIERATLDRLALCGRPRPDLFREDVEDIAERYAIDPMRLANMIRQVESLIAFRQSPATAAQGVFAAARSRAAEDPAEYEPDPSSEDRDVDLGVHPPDKAR